MTAPISELGLPSSITSRIKIRPAEDWALAIFRRGLAGAPIFSLIPPSIPPWFVLVRGTPEIGEYEGGVKHGHIHEFDFAAHIYAEDPDGDEKASLIGDALVDVALQAWREHWSFDGLGVINKLTCRQYPARETDWATSVGPVQYADLPTGDWRYEARFRACVYPAR